MDFGMRGDPSSSNTMAETPSHFFKVILPSTLADKKLMIPEKFVRKFGDELCAVVTLTVPNGRAWHVALTTDGKNMWFNDGWNEFVNFYSICVGHFLVFRYGKESKFHVLIFDPTACEIQYPLSRQDEHEEEVKVRSRFYGSKSVRKKIVMTDERNRAMAAAKAFKPTNPFCRAIMQPSYISRDTMRIPSSFSQQHLHGVSGFIKLQLFDGKQWPVHCSYTRDRAQLSRGWHSFILENNIREGDVCVFEVLRSRDIVLKVTIFRTLESEDFV